MVLTESAEDTFSGPDLDLNLHYPDDSSISPTTSSARNEPLQVPSQITHPPDPSYPEDKLARSSSGGSSRWSNSRRLQTVIIGVFLLCMWGQICLFMYGEPLMTNSVDLCCYTLLFLCISRWPYTVWRHQSFRQDNYHSARIRHNDIVSPRDSFPSCVSGKHRRLLHTVSVGYIEGACASGALFTSLFNVA